ncbi:MAG: anti-sigma regulatory factor [Acidobacteriota bacterium]
MKEGISIPILSETDLAVAVLQAAGLARRFGFSEGDTNLIATSVSELARNILKYAQRGEILLYQIERRGRQGLEVEAQDRGPGIEDLQEALRDHYTTGGGLGLGLPSVRRMMDEFEIESEPGAGTRVRATKWR